ncbi:MAG: nodulation protein NfeD [Chitinophagales bacterium]|nr:nodulation protein NfeD [Chitinophagales bacterium]
MQTYCHKTPIGHLTLYIFTFLLLNLCTLININAQSNIVYRFQIHDEIGPSVNRLTQKAIAEAEKKKASYILIDLDTYGGLVSDADEIRTALLKTKIPTIVFIRNNAASAGALISIACDSIYMRPGATIGAASVVNEAGELAPEKYQSYMRKKMRATAEETGRRPEIAEGMTDESLEIDSIKEAGKIITFSTKEAIKYGYCNGVVDKPEDILLKLSGGTYVMENHEITCIEEIILWLVKPAVSGILLLLIFGGIYFEFKMPGTFLPLGVSIVAAIMYFAPLYLDGMAANWEIIVFALGIVLILLEIFVIPGFGVAGITGITLTITGLTLALVRNIDFDFSFVSGKSLAISFLMVTVAMALPLALLLAFGQRIFSSALFNRVSVQASMSKEDGYSIKDNALQQFIGSTAVCSTDLRPAGKIEIGGERLDAVADGGFIEKGNNVRVLRLQGNYLIVEKI